MRKAWMTLALASTLVVLWSSGTIFSADPKYAIKEVMKLAHTGKPALCGKAVQGKATAAEKKQLLELYEALAANKPPRGDPKAWEERTKALVEAAKALVNNEKDAIAKYKKALNCNACHLEHKPKG